MYRSRAGCGVPDQAYSGPGTNATASISMIESGWISPATATEVLAGGMGPNASARTSLYSW